MDHSLHPDLRALMDLYFKPGRTETEDAYLRNEMEKDPELEANILAFHAIDHALGNALVEQNRALFRQLYEEMKDELASGEPESETPEPEEIPAMRRGTGKSWKMILARHKRKVVVGLVAASVALVCMVAFWPGKSQGEKLFEEFYSPDHSYIVHQGPGPGNHDFKQAMDHFKQGDNDAALPLMQGFWERDRGADSSNYFMGQILLASGGDAEAVPYFEAVESGADSSRFLRAAIWYHALIQVKEVKEGEIKEAAQKLDGLKQVEDRYGRKALELAALLRDLGTGSF
jgi:hypothetical protein